jgi:hypothetical protein
MPYQLVWVEDGLDRTMKTKGWLSVHDAAQALEMTDREVRLLVRDNELRSCNESGRLYIGRQSVESRAAAQGPTSPIVRQIERLERSGQLQEAMSLRMDLQREANERNARLGAPVQSRPAAMDPGDAFIRKYSSEEF